MPLPASQGTPGIPWLWQQNSTLCFRVPWHLRSLCVSPIFILQGHHPIRVGPPHLKLTASANTLLPNMVIFISTRFFFSMSLGGHNSTHNSSFVRSITAKHLASQLTNFPPRPRGPFPDVGKTTGEPCWHKVGATANWLDVIDCRGCSSGKPATVSAGAAMRDQPVGREHSSYRSSQTNRFRGSFKSEQRACHWERAISPGGVVFPGHEG